MTLPPHDSLGSPLCHCEAGAESTEAEVGGLHHPLLPIHREVEARVDDGQVKGPPVGLLVPTHDVVLKHGTGGGGAET